MNICFPFEYTGERSPPYCEIYRDVYTWKLGHSKYLDPDTISVFLTADSISHGQFEKAANKMIDDNIPLSKLFKSINLYGTLTVRNSDDEEFSHFYIHNYKVSTVTESKPFELFRGCHYSLELLFHNLKPFNLAKISCERIDL